MATATTTQPGFDCLIIPGAFVSVTTAVGAPTVHGAAAIATTNLQATLVAGIVGNVPAPPQICGNGAGLGIGAADLSTAANDQGAAVQAGAAVNLSICSKLLNNPTAFLISIFIPRSLFDITCIYVTPH